MDVRNGVGGAVRSDSSGIPNCHQSDIQKWNTHPYDNLTMYCYYFYKLEDILQSWNYYCPCVLEEYTISSTSYIKMVIYYIFSLGRSDGNRLTYYTNIR